MSDPPITAVLPPGHKVGKRHEGHTPGAPPRTCARRSWRNRRSGPERYAGLLSLFEGRLAPYKHPRDVIFLEALPRTSVGKPEKKALRAMTHSHPGRFPGPAGCTTIEPAVT
jgi:hypothetical protein